MSHIAGLFHEARKLRGAPLRPIEASIAAVRELLESSVDKVVHCKLGNHFIIRLHPRNRLDAARGADIDHWQPGAQHGSGDIIGLDAGDNAVTAPALEPRGRFCSALLLW